LRKQFWIRADWSASWEEVKPFVLAALGTGCDVLVCRAEHVRRILEMGSLSLATLEPSPAGWVLLSARDPEGIRKAAERACELRKEKKVALEAEISNKETERATVELAGNFDTLLIRTPDWKIIPLENLIANLHGKIPLLAEVRSVEETRVALQTLELGTDGVLLDPREKGVEEVRKVGEELEGAPERIELKPARVTALKQVGLGERACIDTVTLMSVGEGMLVGNQAEGLFLVHSETLPSPFVEPRPFRVNAGSVHSYVRIPGGKTKYLSELRSGDEVLVVDAKGRGRGVAVGRVKIERRPMILVEAECEGRRYGVILQNAETINLVSKDGSPISVAKLKPGDEVLLYQEAGGRHFGVKVEETITEK
jgi:3-dehydroquinate synthase II